MKLSLLYTDPISEGRKLDNFIDVIKRGFKTSSSSKETNAKEQLANAIERTYGIMLKKGIDGKTLNKVKNHLERYCARPSIVKDVMENGHKPGKTAFDVVSKRAGRHIKMVLDPGRAARILNLPAATAARLAAASAARNRGRLD